MLGQLHRTLTRGSLVRFLMLVNLACVVMGCGSAAPQSVPEQKTKKDLKQPLSYYEATLDPSDYDEEVEAVVQKKDTADRPHIELTIPRDSTTVEEVPQLGFRIQVFSTSSIDEAMKMKVDVLARLPQDSVYVVYDPPVYKVRLGDFPSRYEASIRLSGVVDQGFPDAWIVPDNIVTRKLVRVPRPQGQ